MLQVEEGGRLVGVGAGDGSTSVVSLAPALVTCTKVRLQHITCCFSWYVQSVSCPGGAGDCAGHAREGDQEGEGAGEQGQGAQGGRQVGADQTINV